MEQSLQEKLNRLSNSLRNLQGRVDLQETKTQQELEDSIAEAEGECNRMMENLRLQTEEKKGKVYSDLLKAQMNLRERKQELKGNFARRRDQEEKAIARRDALDAADYAEFLVEIANFAAQDANVAVLEAQQMKMDYEAKFGEPLK